MEEEPSEGNFEGTADEPQDMDVGETDVKDDDQQEAPEDPGTEDDVQVEDDGMFVESEQNADEENVEGEIADDENAEEENRKDVASENVKDEVLWQMRVCPVLFHDFCTLKTEFKALMKLTRFFEYRMSQHLSSKLKPANWEQDAGSSGIPWLPQENLYTKSRKIATAGIVEMNVEDSNLVLVMTLVRSAQLTNKRRLRFELKRLAAKEKTKNDTETENDTKTESNTKTENDTKTESDTKTPMNAQTVGETKTQGNEEMNDNKIKNDEDVKCDKEGPASEEGSGMLFKFALCLKPMKLPAFTHDKDYVLTAKDKQIFLSKVPEDVPDNVLKAIMMADMVERQKEEEGSETVTFAVTSPMGAQSYMELFEGILVNDKEIEMSTTLGTLYEAKKKHGESLPIRFPVKEKARGIKRKSDGASGEAQVAKRARDREELDVISSIWLKGREVAQSMRGILRGKPVFRPRGGLRGATRGLQPRGGLLGRGALRGAMSRGRVRGARGAPSRGLLGAAPLRGTSPRGLMPPRGRGASLRRVVTRGVPRGGGRGEPVGRGATRSRVFVRGGSRGAPPRRGWGAPRRGSFSPRSGGVYRDMDDLQAKLMATQRELELLRQEARQSGHRATGYSDDTFSPGRDFNYRRNDDRFERDFSPPHRRRW